MTSAKAATEEAAVASGRDERPTMWWRGDASWAFVTWLSGWTTALLLLLWTRNLHAGFLFAAAFAMMPAVVTHVRRRNPANPSVLRPLRYGFVVLLVALFVGAVAHWRFELIEYRWPEIAAMRERDIAESLAAKMKAIEENARRAAEQAAKVALDSMSLDRTLSRLDSVQERTGVDGIVLLSDSGVLLGWAGSHRGPLPDAIRTQPAAIHFTERALFSYLYYTVPVAGRGRHAVAAQLIQTGVAGDAAASGFASSFRDQVDAGVTFHAGHPGMGGRAIWSLVSGGDTIVHARIIPTTQADRRKEAEVAPRIGLMLLVLLGYTLLGAGWIRLMRQLSLRGRSVPLLSAIPLFAVAPFGDAFNGQGAFSLSLFVLSDARALSSFTLGSLLALAIPLAAYVASIRRPNINAQRYRFAVPFAALVLGATFTIFVRMLLHAATPALLEGGRALWFGLQTFAVILLAIVASLLLPESGEDADDGSRPETRDRVLVVSGVLLSALLGVIVTSRFDPSTPVSSSLSLLWALPFLCFAFGMHRYHGRSGGLARWAAAAWLAATAVMPHVWDANIDARLRAAEKELATLGSNSDPYLDYLLEDFGREAVRQFDAGEDSVPLLYGTWVDSELAKEPYAAEIQLWDPATRLTVQLGSPSELHTIAEDSLLKVLVDSTRRSGVQELFAFSDQPHMSRVLLIPLGNGEVVSVLVPPRRSLDRRFGVAYFLSDVLPVKTRLNLVKATSVDTEADTVTWRRSTRERCVGDPCAEGWRSRTVVQYPNSKYHASLLVSVAPMRVRVARAVLIVAFDMLVITGLWVLGLGARGVAPVSFANLRKWFRSFRARITMALFAFFLIPTAVFGYVAYRALAQEVARATQLVAERAAEQAAAEFPDQTSSLREMSSHTDTDVLRYHGGELLEVSSPEALQLGVYGAWMPTAVFRALDSGEETGVVNVEELGSQRLLTAYHALQASGTLAVPMPLVSSDTADRQGELAHLILFAALVGAMLSILLSILVGRTLAGPIGRLTRASTAVGAGRLGVRLPDRAPGEFGQLYESFNQMVRRLRRARSRELRTARVLAWGEMARQVAHEIKNPLTPIKLAVQHMRRAYNDKHPDFPKILESNVSQILTEIDHLSEISRAFSRYGAPAQEAGPLQPVEVAQIVREAMMLYRTGDDRLRYHEDVSLDLPPALARAGELKEVLFNLIENARAAIDENGTITVQARVSESHVYVEVADDGTGIHPDMLEKIFDPHFSTRSSGTGLGLAIVRRLVESWGGTVEAQSEPGEGTKVCVRLLPADLLIG